MPISPVIPKIYNAIQRLKLISKKNKIKTERAQELEKPEKIKIHSDKGNIIDKEV